MIETTTPPALILETALTLGAVVSAIIFCFSKKIINASLSFFGLYFFTSAIILNLGFIFLAMCVMFLGILFNIALLSYGVVIVGSLYKNIESNTAKITSRIIEIVSAIVVVLGGVGVCKVMLDAKFVVSGAKSGAGESIGNILLGKHIISLQLMGLLCLVSILGSGLVMRRKS